ncbi:MAG: DUF2802 domain-containing protein [Agarilytica sp.]
MHVLDQILQSLPIIGVCIFSSIFVSYLGFSLVLRMQRKHFQKQINKIETNISILTSGALGMGQKMLTMETMFRRLKDVQEEIKQSDLEFSYTQAQQLMAQGVDDGAIAANSGLSSTEINLMRLLQEQQGQKAFVEPRDNVIKASFDHA